MYGNICIQECFQNILIEFINHTNSEYFSYTTRMFNHKEVLIEFAKPNLSLKYIFQPKFYNIAFQVIILFKWRPHLHCI